MQISALNVSPNPAAVTMAASNNVSNVPPSAYAQTGAYSHPVSFNQSQLAQSTPPNSGIASSALANVSASFPTAHMQQHQAMHPQAHLQSTYAATGAITNSILPASVVDDPQAPGGAQFAPPPQPQDSMQNSYAWSDQHQALAPQQHNPNSRQHPPPPQPPSRYSYVPHNLRGQQSGMLPLPMVGGVRGAVSGALTSNALPHGLNGLSSGGMLTHMGGAMTSMGGLPQANQALMPIALAQQPGYPETDGAAGGRPFGSSQLDIMGAPLRGSVKVSSAPGMHRSPYDASPFGPHAIGSLPPAGSGALGELPDPGAGGFGAPSLPNGGVKHEDSSGPFIRPMKPPRTRMPRSRRKSQPPGTPCVPVHLRNPKKGRDRVFRKCQVCNHDNHIRRSNCDSCKQPLPAGKRRRDGSLSFSSSKKAEAMKAEALKAQALKNDSSHLQGVPVATAAPPSVAPLVGMPQASPPSMGGPVAGPPGSNSVPPIVRTMPTADGHRAN